jgi:hypothetical protein
MTLNPLIDISRVYLQQIATVDESAVADRARNAVADQRLDAAQRDTQSSVDKLKKGNVITRAGAHIAAKRVEADVRKSSAYGPQRPKPGTTGAYRIEGLDPVGKEDSDIDNDGKKNTKKDKYLAHRRNVIKQELATQKEALDPVGKEDADIDNDGKKNTKTDKYLSNRRKVRSSAIQNEGLSNWRNDLREIVDSEDNEQKITEKPVKNKIKINPSISETISNLGGELIEMTEIDEKTLTAPETKKKEEIVKSMKKNLAGFRSRYGDRAKEVMYATATKQAKKVAEQASEIAPKQQPAVAKPNPAAAAKQKQIVQIQKKQQMDKMAQLNKGVPLNSESTADDALAMVRASVAKKHGSASIAGSDANKKAQPQSEKPKRKLASYSIPGAPKEKSYND